jgi:hypothetical protein
MCAPIAVAEGPSCRPLVAAYFIPVAGVVVSLGRAHGGEDESAAKVGAVFLNVFCCLQIDRLTLGCARDKPARLGDDVRRRRRGSKEGEDAVGP